MTIKRGGAVRFSKSNRIVTVCLKVCSSGGLWVDVHAQKLELESIEMRDVRDEVHEIRELEVLLVILS